MKKQGGGRQGRKTLSPIMDEDTEPRPWAITQQHGKGMKQGRGDTRGKHDVKQKHPGEGRVKKGAESNKITLPVLGSLSMKIETNNPYESDKKSNHEALYKSRLLRTKKQKSIEGMFQAAKANKELSKLLLDMNPSFNLEIGEQSLNRFLAPSRHLVPEDVVENECSPEQTDSVLPSDTTQADDVMPADDVTPAEEEASVPLPALLPLTDTKPEIPPPLTAHELVRRSKVIEAVAPSSLWQPAKSLQCEEIML